MEELSEAQQAVLAKHADWLFGYVCKLLDDQEQGKLWTEELSFHLWLRLRECVKECLRD